MILISSTYLVISDIHGCFTPFERLLAQRQSHDKIVIIGDLVDRGPDALNVVRRCRQLQCEEQSIILRGNHDEMFLDFLDQPMLMRHLYLQQMGGDATIRSFLNDSHYDVFEQADEIATWILREFKEEIAFLRHLPYYHETKQCIFVHAGIPPYTMEWRTQTDELVWIREEFYRNANLTGKWIVFGHTPTCHLRGDDQHGIYIDVARQFVGIDGACAYGGQLNALRIIENSDTEPQFFHLMEPATKK